MRTKRREQRSGDQERDSLFCVNHYCLKDEKGLRSALRISCFTDVKQPYFILDPWGGWRAGEENAETCSRRLNKADWWFSRAHREMCLFLRLHGANPGRQWEVVVGRGGQWEARGSQKDVGSCYPPTLHGTIPAQTRLNVVWRRREAPIPSSPLTCTPHHGTVLIRSWKCL